MIDSSEMQAIVQQALKLKAMVAEAAIKAQEDPAVVRARELAHGTTLKEEALKQKIRGLASSRSTHVALGGEGIDDDFARLIAKELGKATAALPTEHVEVAAASSSRSSDAARYDPSTLVDESDAGSEEGDEGYVRLRDVPWPDDPADVSEAVDTSDSDSERSFRFTPRDERVYADTDKPQYFERVLTAAYVPPASRLRLDDREGQVGCGCALLELGKNHIGSKGCAYLCGWLKVSALHTLVLSDNPLGDSGVTLLGRAIFRATQLRCLALQRCAWSGRTGGGVRGGGRGGVASHCKLSNFHPPTHPSHPTHHISRCGATEYGLRHLAAGVGRSASLRQLWLMDNEARCDGARHLASALSVAGLAIATQRLAPTESHTPHPSPSPGCRLIPVLPPHLHAPPSPSPPLGRQVRSYRARSRAQ